MEQFYFILKKMLLIRYKSEVIAVVLGYYTRLIQRRRKCVQDFSFQSVRKCRKNTHSKESIEHIAGTDQEKRRWTKTLQTTSTIRRWRSLKIVSNLLQEKTRIRSVQTDRININWNTWSIAKSQGLERLSYFVDVSRSILSMKFLGLTRSIIWEDFKRHFD